MKTNKIKLYTVAVAFSVMVGFSFFGIKQCVPYADTLTILTYRYLAAAIGVAIWLTILKAMNKSPEKPAGRPMSKLYQNAVFYVLFMVFQVFAMFFATSIEGAIIFAMVPIFAKIIGKIALGETSTPIQNFFVVLTVAALIVLIVLNATDIELNVVGIVIMIISTIFVSFQNVSNRYIRGVFAPIEISSCISIMGTIVFVSATIVRVFMKGDLEAVLEPLKHFDFIFWVSFLGIGCILLTAQFAAYMLAHMQIVQFTVFNSASTLISIVAGALILGEPLQWFHFVCGALILAGVIGLTLAPADAANDGASLGDKMN